MTSRERFEAWWFTESTVVALEDTKDLQEDCWIAWQARDAEVADLQAEADAWRANARDSGVEARKYKAEVERLVEALREFSAVYGVDDVPRWMRLRDKVDALLREYDKETNDCMS